MMTDTEREMLQKAREIAGICGANGRFQCGLAMRVEAAGKPTGELTVDEFIRLIREHRDYFNNLHKPE
jgi:hypothetical protein